ncbi:hypothetical protein V6N00_13430 [Tersicoccus sp. MR15.9]|uniref:hypothetical protein n=1 Tax=Tersicoccus mangrovi TaxID=3121635 RepID=UPI002FE5AC13
MDETTATVARTAGDMGTALLMALPCQNQLIDRSGTTLGDLDGFRAGAAVTFTPATGD